MRRLRDAIRFKKPKGPGLTINKGYYLSVLAAKAQLPPITEVVTPKGDGQTIAGMGVPLAAGSSKGDLDAPMERGTYAIASVDKKTVLKVIVLPKEEVGFDPSVLVKSEAAGEWPTELRLRIEATWVLLQVTFESYDPAVYPALDFFLSVAQRLAELTDGTVADPMSQVYRLPEEMVSPRPDSDQVAAADHVQIKARAHEGSWHVHTLGLTKFDRPEIEVYDINEDAKSAAERFMLGLAQAVLTGQVLEPGAQVGATESPLKVATGGLDRALWEGVPCLELLADKDGGQSGSVVEWLESQAKGP